MKKLSPALIAVIAFLGVITLLIISFFVSYNGKQRTMVAKEAALSAQYLDNQNELSSYVSAIKEALGVADRSTAALDQVLSDAVKGRYEGETSAQPGGGQLFSAITEAYPDLTGMTVNYERVQSAIFAGREAYKSKQSKLLDMLRDYDTWRNSGLLHAPMVRMIGAPSDNLRASIGDDTVRGQDALDRMYRIVLASDAKEAYTTGEMEPLDLGPETSSAP